SVPSSSTSSSPSTTGSGSSWVSTNRRTRPRRSASERRSAGGAGGRQPGHGRVVADTAGGPQRCAVPVHPVRVGAVTEQHVDEGVGTARFGGVTTGKKEDEPRLGGASAVGVGECIHGGAGRQEPLGDERRTRAALLAAELDPVGGHVVEEGRRMPERRSVPDQ